MPSVVSTPSQPFADEDDCLSEGSSEAVRCAHEAIETQKKGTTRRRGVLYGVNDTTKSSIIAAGHRRVRDDRQKLLAAQQAKLHEPSKIKLNDIKNGGLVADRLRRVAFENYTLGNENDDIQAAKVILAVGCQIQEGSKSDAPPRDHLYTDDRSLTNIRGDARARAKDSAQQQRSEAKQQQAQANLLDKDREPRTESISAAYTPTTISPGNNPQPSSFSASTPSTR